MVAPTRPIRPVLPGDRGAIAAEPNEQSTFSGGSMPTTKLVSDYTEFCGALHLHTTYSDGQTDMAELIATAQGIGLDYIIVTDHMTLSARFEGFEGFHDNLAVIVGYEHNDLDEKNHYLVMGTPDVCADQSQPQHYIDAVRCSGGIGFLAHPSEDRHYFDRYPPYPWTDWSVSGFDGIELWNQMSEWVENLKSWRSFIRIFYPRRYLKGVPPDLIRRWDALNTQRFVSGVGGVDAHSYRFTVGIFPLRIFPIKVELKGVRTHLFLPQAPSRTDFQSCQRQILQALAEGHGFISNYRRGDAHGTRIHLFDAQGRRALPGKCEESIALPARLEVSLPLRGEIRVLRNGVVVQTAVGRKAVFAVNEKGFYRIEVFRKGKAWIYSNPFPCDAYPLPAAVQNHSV